METQDNYKRRNKVIKLSPPKILTVNETKLNCTTIYKILKPELYKGLITQQNNSTEKQPQEKKEELPQYIDERSSVKTGLEFFRYFTFYTFLNISIL